MKENDAGDARVSGFGEEYNPKCMRCFFFEACKKDGVMMSVYETKCFDFLEGDEDELCSEKMGEVKRWLEDRQDMVDRLEEEEYWDQ